MYNNVATKGYDELTTKIIKSQNYMHTVRNKKLRQVRIQHAILLANANFRCVHEKSKFSHLVDQYMKLIHVPIYFRNYNDPRNRTIQTNATMTHRFSEHPTPNIGSSDVPSEAPRCNNLSRSHSTAFILTQLAHLQYEVLEPLNLFCRLSPEYQISTPDELRPVCPLKIKTQTLFQCST